MAPMVVLHALSAPPSSRLARAFQPAPSARGLAPLVGPFREPVARVSGPRDLLEDAGRGLPEGAAEPEALAVRLRRRGIELSWGEPEVVSDGRAYVETCRARGMSSVEVIRTDPSLLTELQLGGFFNVYWPSRLLRRVLASAPAAALRSLPLAAAADAAFWEGARSVATDEEWARFTRSSYVVLTYHRLAGERIPGQERLDVDPEMFRRQLRWLCRLGFRPLSPEVMADFHANPSATLPKRSFVLTADDGFRDAVAVIRGHVFAKPQVFVNTACVGGVASFADDRPLASWEELQELAAAGAAVGSHARTHGRLPHWSPEVLDHELAGSLRELRARVPSAIPVLAYPHGSHDERVRAATIKAGYRAAFTTETGRNGAGTDPYCLRRVGVKDWDGPVSLLWKTMTGELVPREWDWWTRRLRLVRLEMKGLNLRRRDSRA
jgi:peptidoglycan/xylan/chitin deacetylase (PgdA/CDA1 family)